MATFNHLAQELKDMIWKRAFSAPATLAEVRNRGGHHELSDGRTFDFDLAFVGPAPYLVGLTCKDARRAMESICGEPLELKLEVKNGPLRFATRYIWINFDTALLYLTSPTHAEEVLESLDQRQVAKIKHVVVSLASRLDRNRMSINIGRMSRCITRMLSGLQSFTFQCNELEASFLGGRGLQPRNRLGAIDRRLTELAACCERLIGYSGRDKDLPSTGWWPFGSRLPSERLINNFRLIQLPSIPANPNTETLVRDLKLACRENYRLRGVKVEGNNMEEENYPSDFLAVKHLYLILEPRSRKSPKPMYANGSRWAFSERSSK